MSKRILAVLALLLTPSPAGAAQGVATTPRETDADVQDVVVVTASRREEQLLNAPATMTVVTAEMIANLQVRSLADVLRLVPGLNVVQSSARDVNVTSRAATGTLSDSLLVLLDGRSIYQDFFGFVAWDFLPIDITEIKQIEVIRGPASAVWGANAMTGVVNVITKNPREMQGTSVAIDFGQFDRSGAGGAFDGGGILSITATQAQATSDRFAYKLSGGVMTQEPFLRPTGNLPGSPMPYPTFDNRGTLQPKLDARADYDLADGRQTIELAGGISGTEGMIHTGLGPLDIQRGSTFKYGRMTYTRDKLRVQFFVNALDGRSPAVLQRGLDGKPLDFEFENQAYDAEFSNLRLWGAHHLVSYGGHYRHNNFDLSFAPAATSRDEGGAYGQDEWVLSDHFRWIIGGRVDHVDVLEQAVFSPRTTFLMKPRASQTFRLSYNRAFRAPSFVNSYFETSFLNQLSLGAAGSYQFPATAVGNRQLNEEKLTAYEAGYIGGFGQTTLGAAVYVYRTKDTILFTPNATYNSSDPPHGWPLPPAVLDQLILEGRGLPKQFTYLNFDLISDRGVELSADVRITTATSVFANYTWQAQPEPTGFDISELNLPSAHHFNAGVSVAQGRYFGSLTGSYVSGAYWQDTGYQGPTAGYTLMDAGFGVHSTDQSMTVGVRGTNLLHRSVQQHVFGDLIGRALTGEVRFHF